MPLEITFAKKQSLNFYQHLKEIKLWLFFYTSHSFSRSYKYAVKVEGKKYA